MAGKVTAVNLIEATSKNMRRNLMKMGLNAGAKGLHFGGCLSCTEILAALYKVFLNIDTANPEEGSRDRFFLSKGHCAAAHYAVLREAGFLSEDELFSFEADGGHFPTHSVMYPEKGIEISSGSLGNGLSFGVGTALAGVRKGLDYRTFVLMGNGECNEGSVWEAVMAAAQYRLENLVAIIDFNGLQLDGESNQIMRTGNLPDVLAGFGWNVIEVDGHNADDLYDAFSRLGKNGSPTAIIANTTKGKGISFMEGNQAWHHGRLSQEDYDKAMAELEGK